MSGVVLGDESLTLRPLELADVDEWLAGGDDEQTRWFEFPAPATRENVIRAIENWMESWRTRGPVRQWAICDIETNRIAGGVEVRDLGGGEVNLSYVVFPRFRRAGVASRAAHLVLRYAAAELGATVAVIKILEGNDASFGVARRLGAIEAGRETSDAGGTFVVFRVQLDRIDDRPSTAGR